MKQERMLSYKTKIDFIIDNVRNFPIQPQNELEKKGIYYCIQTSIESIIDLIAMAVKDLGIPVKDDASNIDSIIQNRHLEQDLGEKLKKANGLRNILVHRYNGLNEKFIFQSLEEIKTLAYNWIDQIEKIIHESTIN
ncbi:MAG: DUF86 domain-containing protein [Promethearchaeota archaeon]